LIGDVLLAQSASPEAYEQLSAAALGFINHSGLLRTKVRLSHHVDAYQRTAHNQSILMKYLSDLLALSDTMCQGSGFAVSS
jgi:hypothetical protein